MDAISILRFGKKPEDPKRKPPATAAVASTLSQQQQGNASKLPRAVEDTLAKVLALVLL